MMFYPLSAGVEIYTLETVIWALCAGAALSSFVMLYYKLFIGEFVRRLLASDAKSPETAVGFKSLFKDKGRFLALAIRRSSNGVWRQVSIAGGESIPKSLRTVSVDVYKSKFYIDPSKADDATDKYDKKGTGLLTAILACAVLAIIALLLIKFVPSITDMFSDAFK